MNLFPITTIIPSSTRVCDAVRMAQQRGAGLWLTPSGRMVVATHGRPGWRKLPIRVDRMEAA